MANFTEEEIKESQRINQELKDLQLNQDVELRHQTADQLLCDFLEKLGFKEMVESFDDLGKWYA